MPVLVRWPNGQGFFYGAHENCNVPVDSTRKKHSATLKLAAQDGRELS